MALKISKINLVLLGMLIVLLVFMAIFSYTDTKSYGDLIEKIFSNSNHSILNQFVSNENLAVLLNS